MFKRLAKIFSPKKSEPNHRMLSLAELPEWLTAQEDDCTNRRSHRITTSRKLIEQVRQEILQLLQDFGVEETEEPLHPKVEQVNRHNLPQFKRKIEAALDVSFSDDDETYYAQVAEMIDGCFKAYRGPGRYLHHLYHDEIKLFRQSMDQIGKELNVLTEIIRTSRIRIGRIATVREALDQYTLAEDELQTALSSRDLLEDRKKDLLIQKDALFAEQDTLMQSGLYRDFQAQKEALEQDQRAVTHLFETLDGLMRNALPVWKKALRIVQDEHDRGTEKMLDQVIEYATLQKYGEEIFTSRLQSSADIIFPFLSDGRITLKNSFEKSLFASSGEYLHQTSEAVRLWMEADLVCQKDKENLAVHPGGIEYTALASRIQDLERDIRHLDEEIGKIEGRIHHLSTGQREVSTQIVREMSELSSGSLKVSGLPDTPEDL